MLVIFLLAGSTMKKGSVIRFVKGTYVGKGGWIDAQKPETNKMYYVIVKDWHGEKETPTRVDKDSVRILEGRTRPASYAEAVLWQNPDIESKLDNICQELAKCSIHQDGNGMVAIIQKKLSEAAEKQASLGNKGTYRHVEFNESSTDQEPSRKHSRGGPNSREGE